MMKENIKDILFLFGIAIILWLLSIAMTKPLLVWLLMWALKFGAVLFVFGGIITIVNAITSYRNRNKNKNDNNNPQ